MEFINTLLTSSLFNLLSFVLGLIGLFLAWYFYRKGLSTKEPLWALRNINLIKGYGTKVSGLDITFKGAPVENLSISRVAIWNNGSLTINGDDISRVDQLRIVGETSDSNPIRILDASILKTNNEPSQLRIDLSDGVVNVKFDYLDKNHGAVIQVIHDGVERKNILIKGTIKGASTIKLVRIYRLRNLPFQLPERIKRVIPSRVRRIVTGIFLSFMALIYIAGAILLFSSREFDRTFSLISTQIIENSSNQILSFIFRLLYSGVIALMGVYVLTLAIRFLKSVIPKDLEDTFEGEIII